MLTPDDFNAILKKSGNLIIDGALATELETRGYDLNHPLWSAKILEEDPMVIKQVHLDYFIAGANIAITASYQASVAGFQKHLGISEDEAVDIIKRSVMLARLALEESFGQGVRPDTPLLIAGSIGPYGAYLADGSEYRGDYDLTKAEFQEFHRARIRALIEAGVDLLAVETMPQYKEIEAVLELLRDEFPNVATWVGCTLKDAEHISDGTSVGEVVQLVQRHDKTVVAIGFNCVPLELCTKALTNLKKLTDLPILVYPNSGEKWNADTKTWYNDSELQTSSFDDLVPVWKDAGASMIGGCCRTGPGHIMAISKKIER